MLRFGIKGKHYIINDEGKMQFEGSERNNSSNTAEYGYSTGTWQMQVIFL